MTKSADYTFIKNCFFWVQRRQGSDAESESAPSEPGPRRNASECCRIFLVILTLTTATCGLGDRHQYVGPGQPTPHAAWSAWVEAVETQNYQLVRDVVRWTGPECGGMAMIALNPNRTDHIDLCVKDHVDHSADSMINVQGPLYRDQPRDQRFAELWRQRIKPFRAALLVSLPVLRAATPKPVDTDTWVVAYPRARYDADHRLLGFNENLTNEIHIKRHNGAWYITDFNCHAMNESRPQ